MKSGYKKVSCVKARFMEGILRYWVLALGLLSEAAIDGCTSFGEWEANFYRKERAGRSDADFVEATGLRVAPRDSFRSCKLPVPKFTVKTQRYVNLGPAKIARKKKIRG